jgi:hypothetical protein
MHSTPMRRCMLMCMVIMRMMCCMVAPMMVVLA